MSMRIVFDTLTPQILRLNADHLRSDVEDELEKQAGDIEEYARTNAPWADRTGEARNGLAAAVESQGDNVFLALSHSVDYGQWLETIQSGRFAIIMPTLEQFSGQVFSAVGAKSSGGSSE
jgi:hypothetical protein